MEIEVAVLGCVWPYATNVVQGCIERLVSTLTFIDVLEPDNLGLLKATCSLLSVLARGASSKLAEQHEDHLVERLVGILHHWHGRCLNCLQISSEAVRVLLVGAVLGKGARNIDWLPTTRLALHGLALLARSRAFALYFQSNKEQRDMLLEVLQDALGKYNIPQWKLLTVCDTDSRKCTLDYYICSQAVSLIGLMGRVVAFPGLIALMPSLMELAISLEGKPTHTALRLVLPLGPWRVGQLFPLGAAEDLRWRSACWQPEATGTGSFRVNRR